MNSNNDKNKVRQHRHIEDILDIQKAEGGSISGRRVVFDIPSESVSTISANLVKSLDSGLSNAKPTRKYKNPYFKKKNPLPEVITWPSDSDITVLRMKLCLTEAQKEGIGYKTYTSITPGDGLHLDSSSMVNLATLYQAQTSKNSLNLEELLPLSSWEQDKAQECELEENVEIEPPLLCELQKVRPKTRYQYSTNRASYSGNSRTSRIANFLRLYFCPCCSLLYDVEKKEDSEYSDFKK